MCKKNCTSGAQPAKILSNKMLFDVSGNATCIQSSTRAALSKSLKKLALELYGQKDTEMQWFVPSRSSIRECLTPRSLCPLEHHRSTIRVCFVQVPRDTGSTFPRSGGLDPPRDICGRPILDIQRTCGNHMSNDLHLLIPQDRQRPNTPSSSLWHHRICFG